MTDQPTQSPLLNHEPAQPAGPVECLGLTFASDAERRAHFLALLAEKLKDPAFRKIEGFPIGTDEDILALSDPPYYTACPNPWIGDFVAQWEAQKPPKPADHVYHREPFAADVSEGKNDPIYNAHSYHTKVPHKAIMRYILHYTEPGDIVFDGFCGTGMTGVAAFLCGNNEAVRLLGYEIAPDGTILRQETDATGKATWEAFSRLGIRNTVLNDLSPAAVFIAHNYNTPVDVKAFENEAKCILSEVEKECAWMYETRTHEGSMAQVNYTVWSDVFICPNCANELVFWEAAVDHKSWQVSEDFHCLACQVQVSKRALERAWILHIDEFTGSPVRTAKQIPVLIHYKVSGHTRTKAPDTLDAQLLAKIDGSQNPYWIPNSRLPSGDKMSDPRSVGIATVGDFYFSRALWTLSKYNELARNRNSRLLINLTSSAIVLSRQYRFRSQGESLGAGGGPMNGTLYVPSLIKEIPALKVIGQHIERMSKVLSMVSMNRSGLSTGSLSNLSFMKDASVDYIFLDPPFGSNIMYSELNYLWEAWLRVFTNQAPEAIENRTQHKGANEYRQLMTACFKEAYRVLKPGRWMTVEFSNTRAAVWNNIQTALTEAGFIVANVSALDKRQGSFNAVTTPTAVRQDLVISAYKPNGGFEARFHSEAATQDGVWDFVRTHLKYLPIVKRGPTNRKLVAIPERDPRILYDEMVAYYVRRGFSVPLDSQEFQKGLEQRFSQRDGMCFLPDQVVEYDKRRLAAGNLEQAALFVSDESSAISWLRQQLRLKPQTFSEINPQFMKELAGWSKNEVTLELSTLLEQNFLLYSDNEPVPEQIHAYLSSNWKELRGLAKNDPALVAKARNRWYVPDPNKAADLEKIREKALLKEFDEYQEAKKKLKIFRLEAIRAGFKRAWQNREYATIITVAEKIPEEILQEDPKLLMWYDQARTRLGVD